MKKGETMSIKRWTILLSALAVIGLGTAAAPLLAHHSSAPFYDSNRTVEAQGTITKYLFKNPHAFLYFESTEPSGQKVEWQIELGGIASLTRTGWTPENLKFGTPIKAAGRPSKAEGTHGMCCAKITKPDGSPIVAGRGVQEQDVR